MKYAHIILICLFISCTSPQSSKESPNLIAHQANSYALKEFTTEGNYIYESINKELNQYTNLAFYPDKTFRITAYEIQFNESLRPVISLDGTWSFLQEKNEISGTYNQNGKTINWRFTGGYSQITNSMGTTFTRINPNNKAPEQSDNRPKTYSGNCDEEIATNMLIQLLTKDELEIIDGPTYAYDIVSIEEIVCEFALTTSVMNSKDSIHSIETCVFIIKKIKDNWEYEKKDCTLH